MIKGTGINDKQAPLKLYKAPATSNVGSFNLEIRAYKAAVVAKDKQLNFTKLITIAYTEYTSLIMCS
eukprot:1380306-Ditylum_brightwellii.AAC.1